MIMTFILFIAIIETNQININNTNLQLITNDLH
jgi:hypothetical protein